MCGGGGGAPPPTQKTFLSYFVLNPKISSHRPDSDCMTSMHRKNYETLLAEYSDPLTATELLKHYRPYLELVPSMRRPQDSLISLPLPLAKIRREANTDEMYPRSEVIQLPCDVAIVMCDPEWKIKLGAEICLYIYRPEEDFSDFLGRWRRTQVLLSHLYEWVMPRQAQDIFSEGEGNLYPLFVLLEGIPKRILRGLKGANLPYVVRQPSPEWMDEEPATPEEANPEDDRSETLSQSASIHSPAPSSQQTGLSA